MKNDVIEMTRLQSQVGECYTYFMNNNKKENINVLEDKLQKLHDVMIRLTITNLVNIMDRVVEDGRKNTNNENRQYNVSSIQISKDNKIILICHEVVGFDNVDKKFILDNIQSYIDFTKVVRIY